MDEINENKTTPKTSDTGLEYIREMVSRGFLKKNMIPSEEAEGFEELEKNGSLPEGVYPTTNGTKRAYCHVENTAPDMTGEEIDRLIAMRKANDIHTIRNWVIFFGVITIVGIVIGCFGGGFMFTRYL